MSLVAGVPANLTCRSRGDAHPTPELLWFRDGIRLDGAIFRQVRSKSLCQPFLAHSGKFRGPLRPQAHAEEKGMRRQRFKAWDPWYVHKHRDSKARLCVQAKSLQSFPTLYDPVVCQVPLSMGFSRQEYWSGLLCSPPADLSDPEIESASLMSLALAGGFFTTSATWEAPIGLDYLG